MIYIYTWTDGTELYHHGILDQKWGVRRYQNKDGSLTAAGKIRKNAANAGKSAGKTFKNVAVQQTSQKIVGKVSKQDKKKESVKDIAKTIAKGAAIAAATTALSSFLLSSSDMAIKAGKNFVSNAIKEQYLDALIAKYYGWY